MKNKVIIILLIVFSLFMKTHNVWAKEFILYENSVEKLLMKLVQLEQI